MSKNMPKVKEKFIIIKTPGLISVMGNISGPILKSFKASVNTIFHLVVTRYEVYQVLRNGTQILLDIDNYDVDFEKVEKDKKKEGSGEAQQAGESQQTQQNEETKQSQIEYVEDDKVQQNKQDKPQNNQNNNQNQNQNKKNK